jgi:hypothetical protein
MQYAWLEKMASEGHIRPEAKAKIYDDCSKLLKLAAKNDPKQDPVAEKVKKVLNYTVGFGSNLMINSAWEKLMEARGMRQTVDKIRTTRAGLLSDPAFQDYKEKADARFTELAKVAPTLAANPAKAKELVGKSLHTGFSNDDMNHLAVIQAVYTANDPEYTSRIHDRLTKKASATRLGEMYADVLVLVKEAGLLSSITGGINRAGAAAAEGVAKTTGGIRPSTAMQVLKNVALVSSIPVLAGVGQGLVSEYAASRDSKQMAAKLRESFNEALRLSEKSDLSHTNGFSLRDRSAEAMRVFQALAHFAPHVAMQPDAAHAFMTRIVSSGLSVDTPDIKQLTDIEKNMANAGKQSPFFEGFTSAVKGVGLGEGIRSTIKDTTEPLREKTRQAISRDIGLKPSRRS